MFFGSVILYYYKELKHFLKFPKTNLDNKTIFYSRIVIFFYQNQRFLYIPENIYFQNSTILH